LVVRDARAVEDVKGAVLEIANYCIAETTAVVKGDKPFTFQLFVVLGGVLLVFGISLALFLALIASEPKDKHD
jgi:hypothetical protein